MRLTRLTAAVTSFVAAAAFALAGPAAPALAADASGNILDQLERFGATALAKQGVDGRGIGIALIDTGVVGVPGLPAAQVVNGPDLSVESQAPTLRYLDTNGHGTAMAGIIVGADPATGYRGVAPKAKLTSIKVGAADGSVDVTQVIAAIDWAVEHRLDDPKNPIRVINLAYGTDSLQDYVKDPLDFAVENAWRNGIAVVVAAGNTGATLAKPADDPFVISVGSTGDSKMSSVSKTAGRRTVDLVVNAEKVLSFRNPGSFLDRHYPSARIGESLFRGSGTSQASAMVSGAVALLLQKRPGLTNNQIKDLLVRTGSRVGSASSVNLTKAMTAQQSLPLPQFHWPSTGTGSFQQSRGTTTMVDSGVALSGERDIFGPLNSTKWAVASLTKTSWSGGKWMGRTMAGSGWTGTSWASRTWASATWPGNSWSGKPWPSSDWNGRYWAGRYWAGGEWSGRYWAGRYWAATSWSTKHWG